MPAKNQSTGQPLYGAALIKEVCRRIRVARGQWEAHNNRACRGEREKALALYETLNEAEHAKVPQALRVWLRYRSEKYFGEGRTAPGGRSSKNRSPIKEGLHPRNRFRARYDFKQLIACCPALARFVAPNGHGEESISYADPEAVKVLNQALLRHAYGLQGWDIPQGYLCPPVPGRSDYLHHLADLLGTGDEASIPRGRSVAVLDIGVGANCIYPLIGASEYGWRFVGSDIDSAAVEWAGNLAASNRGMAGLIECRLQNSATECFKDVIRPGEFYDASMCNPPFHASADEAAAGTRRKLNHLRGGKNPEPVSNCGGRDRELWCKGGELAFVRRMVRQSAEIAGRCLWFTTLVSKGAHLSRLQQSLKDVAAADVRIIGMSQGNKKSRLLAWTFLRPDERNSWRRTRR